MALNPSDRVEKTEQGLLEVKARSLRLAPRLRSLLIMADGRRTVAELQDAGAQIGAPADGLAALADLGLVQLRAAPTRSSTTSTPAVADNPTVRATTFDKARLRTAQRHMNSVLVAVMGPYADYFTAKVDRTTSREDLLELVPQFVRLIAQARGAGEAAAQEQKALELLEA